MIALAPVPGRSTRLARDVAVEGGARVFPRGSCVEVERVLPDCGGLVLRTREGERLYVESSSIVAIDPVDASTAIALGYLARAGRAVVSLGLVGRDSRSRMVYDLALVLHARDAGDLVRRGFARVVESRSYGDYDVVEPTEMGLALAAEAETDRSIARRGLFVPRDAWRRRIEEDVQ